jgi:protein phosphatase
VKPVTKRVELRHGAATDVGCVREVNEDAYLAEPPVFVVADGMGGHEGGDVASRIVAEEFGRLAAEGFDATAGREAVEATLGRCQLRILEYAAQQVRSGVSRRRSAGTTVVAALLVEEAGEPAWLLANLGDSRVYRVVDGRLEQVSTDHSLVQEMVAAGRITPEEAAVHPERNVITRALGESSDPRPDFFVLGLADADRLLLCTDGITGMLDDDAVARALAEAPDAREAAPRLVAAAVEAGGEDNATAVVVDVVGLVADDDRPAGDEERTEADRRGRP